MQKIKNPLQKELIKFNNMKNKRIVFLATILMVLPLGGKVFAQAALKIYKGETLPMRAHVFSASATEFNGFSDGDSIFRLWLKPDGTTEILQPVEKYTTNKPALKTGNASLSSDGFYFGEKQMKYFGLTGGGLVYFGETDKLRPTYNPVDVMGGTMGPSVVEDFIFLRFLAGVPPGVARYPKNTEVLATASTSVKYEVDADTLFIAYNDVKVLDTGKREFVMSFQYAFTKDGDVLFIPVAMQPQGEPDAAKAQNIFYFNYGLYSEQNLKEACFLSNLAGGVTSGQYNNIEITKTSYPTQTCRMFPPEHCVAVENPSVGWSYIVATDYIELHNNVMTCNGQHCLFILSSEETLSGENLPVDGTEYDQVGATIGSSLFVTRGDVNFGKLTLAGTPETRRATGLAPGTTYYLHAFPYNNDCIGVRYNTTNPPKQALTTAIRPVNSISATSITENRFTLNIDKGDAELYVLAVSPRQISPFAHAGLSPKEGGYKAGDKLYFSYVSAEGNEYYELKVLTVSADATYEVTDAQPNSTYYYYVWSTDAAQTKCSFDVRTCGVATPYHIPAVFTFDMAAVTQNGLQPAGWTLPIVKHLIKETGAYDERSFRVTKPISQRYLSAPLRPYPDDSTALCIETFSPIIKGGRNVDVTVEFYFYKMPTTGVDPVNASLRDGDTIYIQYKGLSENTWTPLHTITKDNVKPGIDTVTTNDFYLSEDFQLRFVAVSTKPGDGQEGYPTAGISKIRVASVCHAISSEPEVSQIMHDRATLSWEDENNSPRSEAYHIRYRLSENDAWTGQISKNRNYTYTRLAANTYYTMEVAAVCASGDTSEYVNVSFATLHGLPYRFTLASKEGSSNPDTLPEGVTLKAGVLPASGTASPVEPDAEKTVWAPMQKAANVYGAGLTVDADLNNPLWLNLPVLSTGVSRGKARLSLKLSAWSAADSTQPATFGATDTCWVLLSTDNKFNAASAKIKVDWSEVTPQGKTYTLDFDVENPYQYWAFYTGLQTAGNVLFIDSLNIEWTEIYCDAVTGLRQSNLGYYSVDISWKGEGEEYGIFYNDRATDKWDTVYTMETTYHLDKLEPSTAYQYYVVVYCDADHIKMSDKSETRFFQTERKCDVPTLELVEGSETWQGVTTIARSKEKTRQYRIEPKDIERYPLPFLTNGTKDTVRIRGLYYYEAIPYYIKVRTLCPRDTSDWSEVREFTTLPFPECGNPTNLRTRVNAAAKTASFYWVAGEKNLNYEIYVRAGSASRQDTLYSSTPTYTLTGIQSDVVYTWKMKAFCEYPLSSNVVNGNPFGTNVGVESVQSFDKAVKVRVFEDQILIENNEELYIKSLQAFSVDGKLLKTYPVNSAQNVYIYHTLPKGAALLRVLGENGKTATYKTIIL